MKKTFISLLILSIWNVNFSKNVSTHSMAINSNSYKTTRDGSLLFGFPLNVAKAPSVPTNLIQSNVTQTSCTLSWTASTDNVGVFGYEIFKNGAYYGATTSTSLNITGLTCGNEYSFTVNAFDGAQPANISGFSIPKIVTTSNCLTNNAPAHLKYFGFYFIDVEYDDDPTDGIVINNYTNEVANFTNLAQMATYFPSQNLNARINAMNAQCVKPFVSLQEIFHSRVVDATTQSGFRYVLYSDFSTRWNNFKTTNATSLTAAKIGAFYLSDEPTFNGVSFAELNTISNLIKNDFPTIPILLVEAYVSINNLQVPSSVDWLGFDQYFMFNPSTNAGYLQNLANLKTKRSSPNQKIFITIDNSWIPSYGTAGQTQAMMANTVQDYYNVAASDTDIVGLLSWIWPNRVDQTAHIGARSLPQNVKDKNIEIGYKIKANFNPCNSLSIEEVDSSVIENNFEIKLYPNPGISNVSIEYNLKENGIVNIRFYDLIGKQLISEELNEMSGNKIFNINTRNLKDGVYLVKVIINKHQYTKRLIIKNN
jgi:Secretion system C-terminal sorting domain